MIDNLYMCLYVGIGIGACALAKSLLFICGGQEALPGVLANEDTRAAAVKRTAFSCFILIVNLEFPILI